MCMWCCVHVIHVMLYTCGFVYMSCMCYCVHVVWCMCGVVYALCRWCHVHVMLCTCCAGGVVYKWYYVHVISGNGVHVVLVHVILVVLGACNTMYVHCVVMVLWHAYLLCCTLCTYMHFIQLYIRYRCMYSVVVYTGCTCMCCMSSLGTCIIWCSMQAFILKVVLGQHAAIGHQHEPVVVQSALILKTTVSSKFL